MMPMRAMRSAGGPRRRPAGVVRIAAGGRLRRFADTIARRYDARAEAAVAGVRLTLVTMTPVPVRAAGIPAWTTFVFRPTLAVSVTNLEARLTQGSYPMALAPAPADPLQLAARVDHVHTTRQSAELLVQRLRTRETRVESTPNALAAVVRVHHRVPPPIPEMMLATRRSPAALPTVAVEDSRPRLAPPVDPRAPVQPPLDLGRITDHVMQTLDRRIAAQRERAGRR